MKFLLFFKLFNNFFCKLNKFLITKKIKKNLELKFYKNNGISEEKYIKLSEKVLRILDQIESDIDFDVHYNKKSVLLSYSQINQQFKKLKNEIGNSKEFFYLFNEFLKNLNKNEYNLWKTIEDLKEENPNNLLKS